jgi:uncharacterized phage protein (TIGR02216 family)
MHLGLGVLRLPPGDFWQMTLKELSAAIAVPHSCETMMDHAGLDALMRVFPDK